MPQVLDPMKKNEIITWVVGLFVLVGGIYGYALFTAPTAINKSVSTSQNEKSLYSSSTVSSGTLFTKSVATSTPANKAKATSSTGATTTLLIR